MNCYKWFYVIIEDNNLFIFFNKVEEKDGRLKVNK